MLRSASALIFLRHGYVYIYSMFPQRILKSPFFGVLFLLSKFWTACGNIFLYYQRSIRLSLLKNNEILLNQGPTVPASRVLKHCVWRRGLPFLPVTFRSHVPLMVFFAMGSSFSRYCSSFSKSPDRWGPEDLEVWAVAKKWKMKIFPS